MIVGVTVYRTEISTYSKQAYSVTYRVVYMHANYLQSLGSLLVNLLTFYTKLLNIYKKFYQTVILYTANALLFSPQTNDYNIN